MPPRVHVQFAAGELADDLEARQGAGVESPGAVARRDLERYYALLRDELARVRLTEAEAMTIVAACRGWLIEPSSYRYLWVEVDDYLRDQVEDTGVAQLDDVPRLDAAGRAVLVAKLRGLTPGGALALADAVERYWAAAAGHARSHDLGIPGHTIPGQLRAAGIVRD